MSTGLRTVGVVLSTQGGLLALGWMAMHGLPTDAVWALSLGLVTAAGVQGAKSYGEHAAKAKAGAITLDTVTSAMHEVVRKVRPVVTRGDGTAR